MSIVSKRSLVRLVVAGAVAAGGTVAVAGTASAAPADAWDRLVQCEASGNWSANTGNGFYGGLQFTASTWRAFGGSGSPQNASRAQQIAVAERVLAGQGWGAWPACSRKLGLSGTPAKKAAPVKQRLSAPAPQAAPKVAAPKAAPKVVEPKAAPKAVSAPVAPAAVGNTHTVAKGDTLSAIAAAQGTTWQALFAKNRNVISDADLIRPGQVLTV